MNVQPKLGAHPPRWLLGVQLYEQFDVITNPAVFRQPYASSAPIDVDGGFVK
jgi:hypothetical protein